MKLTSFTDYAFRTLIYVGLKKTEELSTAREISKYHNISYNHIVKVIHSLSKKGYLETLKGRNGGIRLKKSPKEINLGQLVLDVEIDFYIVDCFDKKNNTCRIIRSCKLQFVLKEALFAFNKILSKYTLADVLKTTQRFPI